MQPLIFGQARRIRPRCTLNATRTPCASAAEINFLLTARNVLKYWLSPVVRVPTCRIRYSAFAAPKQRTSYLPRSLTSACSAIRWLGIKAERERQFWPPRKSTLCHLTRCCRVLVLSLADHCLTGCTCLFSARNCMCSAKPDSRYRAEIAKRSGAALRLHNRAPVGLPNPHAKLLYCTFVGVCPGTSVAFLIKVGLPWRPEA
jgi:hypothetical protein